MQANYIAGVAIALVHPEADIRIVSVVEVGFRRRLLALSIEVKTQVSVQTDEAVVLSQSVTSDILNTVLVARGIRVVAVTPALISTQTVVSTTTSSVMNLIDGTTPPSKVDDGIQIMTIIWIASSTTAALLFLVIGCLLHRRHRKASKRTKNSSREVPAVSVLKVENFYNYGQER